MVLIFYLTPASVLGF